MPENTNKLTYIEKGEALNLPKEKWELTFYDDFKFLDKEKWKINTAINEENPKLNGVRRAAYYTDDEDIIFIKDNKLHIRTKWKNGKFGEGWYTGFLETSKYKHNCYKSTDDYKGFSQVGGYFECRCKCPRAVGIWSAFWLMPDNDIAFTEKDVQFSGEDGIEIDVMESPNIYKDNETDRNQNVHVLHADGYDSRLKTIASPSYYVPNMYEDFHTYGFMWQKDKYSFYIDGHKTWETEHIYKGKNMGICKALEYMILSVEVSGSYENGKQIEGKVRNSKGKLEDYWNGNPALNDKAKNYDFVIDYVKAYKEK